MRSGCVLEEERDLIRNTLIEELKKLIDPTTGKYMKIEAYKAEDVYSGSHLKDAPDIAFIIDEGRCEVDAKVGDGTIFEDGAPFTRWTGTHTRNGIFMAKGPCIKRGYKLEKARITDVASTILHLFGIPIPPEMDGEVLEIFEDDTEFKKRESIMAPSIKEKMEPSFNEEEKALIEARLRKLGYI
jgi:predicted AlkP superfamily phosphohydrolase/phosphomutase